MVTYEGDAELIAVYANKIKVPKGVSKVVFRKNMKSSVKIYEDGTCIIETTPGYFGGAEQISEDIQKILAPEPNRTRLRKKTSKKYLQKRSD